MQQREVEANGVRFAVLEEGDGPLVLLLHGFPDSAWSWERQMPVLAAAGFRACAPFLRGYPPTEVAAGFYDRATLALDVRELIRVLGGGAPARIVAQDWGAAIAYGVLGAFPEAVTSAVLLAVPHPAEVRRTLRGSPVQVLRSFHWFLFQLPWLPEALCRARDFAFLEFLWWLWSPAYADRAHVARVKDMMRAPGALEASLAYYRAMFRARNQDPALAELRTRLDAPIRVPTLVACGSRDLRARMLPRQADRFAGEYEWRIVDDAGHFLHREKPEAVNAIILEWLTRARS